MTTVLDFLVMMNWRRAAAVVLDKGEVDNGVAGLEYGGCAESLGGCHAWQGRTYAGA